MDIKLIKEIIHIFRENHSFLITSHVNPDGDAIGSMGGVYYLLKQFGKEVDLYNVSGVPDRFSYLSFSKYISTFLNKNEYDCIIFLDCGDISRAGEEIKKIKKQITINIDHHPTNDFFADINWVNPNMSSVGEMVAYLLEETKIELKGKIAESIYTAIVSDTGSFTFSNTKPTTLKVVMKILENGFDLDDFNRKYQRYWTINKVHFHGMAMQRAKLLFEGKVAIISIPMDLMKKTGCTTEDCEGVINYIRQIRGVKVAAILREDDDKIKVSLRSWGEVDVSQIALELNGGGHKNAAGGSIFLPLEQAEDLFLNCIEKYIS
jgi:phosphoesterase RecJ-like protein